MVSDTSDSQPLDEIVHEQFGVSVYERSLPIYPLSSTRSGSFQRPSLGTHASQVTSRVSDYGRNVRQRNEAGERLPRDNNALAGLQNSVTVGSLNRPDVISDEDLKYRDKDYLKNLLNGALQLDQRNNEKRFLPSGDLKTICNHSAVCEELITNRFERHHAQSCATYICEKPAREIFAVLVLINQIDFLPDFIREGIVDDNLPFSGDQQHTELWYREPGHKKRVAFLNYPKHAEMMREFYNKQWWVHVPFLDWDKANHKALNFRYDLGTVIPWTEISDQDTSGGFGVVEKVKIHQDHHSFTQYETFALKTIIRTCDDEDYKFFQKEIAAFRKMRPGPHLVELCATLEITPGDNFMLLFPWAEGGSLEDLMRKPRTDLLKAYSLTEKDFVRWIAIQSRGLIDALGTIHDTRIKHSHSSQDGEQIDQHKDFGIHGDIKPANILHFSQETAHCRLGNLKVADFGLITFHTRASRTMINRHSAYAASQTYRSPEHDICYFMSKKVDVWALGCVFSELMTWVILDGDARKDYQQKRKKEPSFSGAAKSKGQWSEDNFFVKHIQKKKKKKKKQVAKPRPVLPRHRPRRESISESPEDFQEVPRLKVSVKEWIDVLICKAHDQEGSKFLEDFLEFIRSDMLNPKRIPRTDCDNAVKFLNDYIPQDLDISWNYSLR
ncbi:serine/threonine protein kinase [Fusarium sporotrichioides]|uniref:Serine/threonine protein kinase n=1 Tax=Fusarium sporotrichioides TaxID=5514 RepID=A0A395RLL9_FUSSP|nr:serine/threonine protein kinase [Fusarium sporotrichioides]